MPCARAAPAPALTPPLLPVTGTCSAQALGGTCAMLLTVLLKRSCFLMCATAETARLGFPQGLTSLLTSTGNCGAYTSKSGKVTGTHGQQARNRHHEEKEPWEHRGESAAPGGQRCEVRTEGGWAALLAQAAVRTQPRITRAPGWPADAARGFGHGQRC